MVQNQGDAPMRMMLPCREVSRLVSRGLDGKLSVRQRAALHIHFAICKSCRNFDRQVRFLRRAMQRLPETGDA